MKKKNVWKRVAAVAAAVVVSFTTGITTYAATSDELRQIGQEALNNQDYEKAIEAYRALLASGESRGSDYWYAAKAESGLENHYGAYECYMKLMADSAIENGSNRELVYAQMVYEMFKTEDYWTLEQLYQESKENYNICTPYMKLCYGDSLYNQEDYREAKRVYEEAQQDYADNPNTVALLENFIGECNLKLKEYDVARQNFQNAYEVMQNQEDYCMRMLQLGFALGETDVEAMDVPGFQELSSIQKANALMKAEHYEEAIPYFAAAVSQGEDVGIFYAYVLSKAGDYEAAIEEANRLIALDSSNADAWEQLGCIYCDGTCEYDLAVECFTKAYELNPESTYGLPNNLVAYSKKGDMGQLFQQISLVREKFPRELTSYKYEIQYTRDITPEAALSILSEYPDFPTDEVLQGQLLIHSTKASSMTVSSLEAFLAYTEQMLAGPAAGNYYFLECKAICLRYLGRTEEALEAVNVAIEKAGLMESDARWERAQIYGDAGRFEEAAGDLIYLYENYADAKALIRLAENCLQVGNYEEALVYAQELADKGDKETAMRLRLERLLLMEDYEAMVTLADQAMVDYADNANILALTYAAMEKLGMDGREELIAKIDAIPMSMISSNRLAVDSLLGRYEDAIQVVQGFLDYYPGYMPGIRQGYRYANLAHSQEYAELAGVTYVEPEKEASIPWIPVAAGAGVLALAGIGVAIVVGKRK